MIKLKDILLSEKFASKAQQAYLFAKKPDVAKKLASKMNPPDYKELPDKVTKKENKKAGKCLPGYKTHPKRKTKKMFGKTYRNCVKKEEIEQQEPNTLFKQGPNMDVRKDEVDENLRQWFGKGGKGSASGGGWDRYNTKGEKIGKCGDRKKGEGKPKCLSKAAAAKMTKKEIGAAVRKKRRKDKNPNRRGKAKNVSSKTRKRSKTKKRSKRGKRK